MESNTSSKTSSRRLTAGGSKGARDGDLAFDTNTSIARVRERH